MIRLVSKILTVLIPTCALVFCGQPREAFCAEVVYTYDALNRLVSATFDNGKKIRYTYDAAGNIVKETVVLTVDSPQDTSADTGEDPEN